MKKTIHSFLVRRATFTVAALAAAAAVYFAPAAYAAPPSQVAYTVTLNNPGDTAFRVTAKAQDITGPSVSFAIPGWSPGWYVLTHAYENIHNVSASDENGAPLNVTHSDNLTWNVATNNTKSVTVSYDLDGREPPSDKENGPAGLEGTYGFFAPALSKTNGYVPGPASLMYVVDGKTAPCRVTYNVPTGWKIASANTPTSDPKTFTAPDYDILVDQPADLGTFTSIDRTVGGVPVSVVLIGAGDHDTSEWVSGVFKIAAAGIKAYGGAPFPRYIFHFRFPPSSEGMAGLEHLNSTTITTPVQVLDDINLAYLSVVAHEFTHAWNVKRVRSLALGPFDYTKPVRVKDLWWLEGGTEYFAPYLMVRAGLGDADFWRGYIVKNIAELQNNPARESVTLETASLKAWEGQSEGFGGLSYYNKGMLVAFLLDVEMRKRTNNRVGVLDLLKALYKQSQTTGKGFAEGEIERLASGLTGSDLTPFFNTALRSTDELPFEQIVAGAGLKLNTRVTTLPYFGIEWDFGSGTARGIRIAGVVAGSPADKAGLKANDVLTGVNDRTGTDGFGVFFQSVKPGDQATFTALRDGVSQKFTLTVSKRDDKSFRLIPYSAPTPAQTAIFDSITGTKP